VCDGRDRRAQCDAHGRRRRRVCPCRRDCAVFLRTEEFFSLGRVLLFVPLFPLFGIALGVAIDPSRRFVSLLPSPARASIALAAALMAGLVLFGIVAPALGLDGGFVM
jgi:hypothetical protein